MTTRAEMFKGSLAAAEGARDTRGYSGFIAGLFEGTVRRSLFASASIPVMNGHAREFFDALRLLLVEKVDPEAIDREGTIGEEVIESFRAIGAFGIKIPRSYGGLGLSQSEYHTVATLLGSHDAATSVLLSAHNSIGVAEPVKLVGTREQQQRLLPRLAQGDISGFALTEKGAGCDIWDLKTYAIPVYEGSVLVGYRLTGEKLYTTNAPREDHEFLASLLVVIAQIVAVPQDVDRPKEERRFGAFVIETRSEGCRCTRLSFMGVRGIYNGQVHLRDVFVPLANRLGEEGEGLRRALESLTVGRLALPAACLGSLKQCLWLARARAQERIQYDRPIGQHTDIGSKIVVMASRVLALEAIVKITGIWADAKVDVRLESAAAKVLATEWLLESLLDLFRIYGGRAFETPDSLRLHGDLPVPVERMIRDALINVIWEGSNGILTLWIAREGLAEYVTQGRAFLERGIEDMAQAVAFFAGLSARAFNPIAFLERGLPWGSEAAPWERFVSQQSRALARKTLWVSGRDRYNLPRNQRLLRSLVTAGLQLFAVEALLWYGSQPEIRELAWSQALVEDFCLRVKETFHPAPLLSLKTPLWDDDRRLFKLSKEILAGRAGWLEDGIIPCCPGGRTAAAEPAGAMGGASVETWSGN